MINKPITIIRQEFVDSLIDLCNNSNLPYFCVESILKEILDEVHRASVRQFEMDKDNYDKQVNKELKSQSEKGNGEEAI